MKRTELDRFIVRYQLSPEAAAAALALSGAIPSSEQRRHFAARVLQLAGVLSFGAGIVFFVAANWSAIGIFGRFALLEAAVALAGGLALWRPPPQLLGRLALLGAFIALGALLALFGQTYQTGADVYELFLSWSLLGLLFVVAAQWSVVWAAWLLVLNVALSLFCAGTPSGGWLWDLFGGLRGDLPLLLLIPSAVNLSAWLLAARIHETRSDWVPDWLVRLTLACMLFFATWAGAAAIADSGSPSTNAPVLVLVVALLASVVMHTLARRRDAFPIAATVGSVIVLVTTAILDGASDPFLPGTSLLIAAWLIASSTAGGRIVVQLSRMWSQANRENPHE